MLQAIAVSYMEVMPSGNSSRCTSYVLGIGTMQTGRDFDDQGGGHSIHMAIVGGQ